MRIFSGSHSGWLDKAKKTSANYRNSQKGFFRAMGFSRRAARRKSQSGKGARRTFRRLGI